ncbi:MAG: tetratricopeptide repeat protein [Pyrinomonadaceae bacterium]
MMSHNRRIGLLLGLVVLLLSIQSTRSETRNIQKANPPLLRRNSSLERQLSGGGKQSATVTLSSGQYFQLDIEQHGIDVATTVFHPDAKQVEFDTPSGANGTESVRFIAEADGDYRIEFRSLLKEVDPGRYRARVVALREATTHDKLIVSAIAAQRHGDELRAKPETRQKSVEQYEIARKLWQSAGSPAGEASTVRAIGFAWFRKGNSQKAIETFEKAAQLWHAAGEFRSEAFTYGTLGFVYERQNNSQKVLENNLRALPIWRRLHDAVQEAFTLSTIGDAHAKLGGKQEPLRYCKLAVSRSRDTQKRSIEAAMLRNCGQMFIAANDLSLAKDYLTKSLALWRAANFKNNEAMTLTMLGEASEKLGEKTNAIDYYSQAQTIWRTLNEQSREAEMKIRIARLSERQ